MFHVGPMIPMQSTDDPSRKRYIGNDIVVIIFRECSAKDEPAATVMDLTASEETAETDFALFDAHQMRSQFNRSSKDIYLSSLLLF